MKGRIGLLANANDRLLAFEKEKPPRTLARR